jgi:hypothetical protein
MILLVLLLGGISVNAASALLDLQLLYSRVYNYPPQHRYLEGYATFNLTQSDMRKDKNTYEQTKRVAHKLFAHDEAYYNMIKIEDRASLKLNYQAYVLAPYHPVNNPNGGNYGGDPCYVLVQAGDFYQGLNSMSSVAYVDTIMMAPIGDTWVKEEIIAWVYGGVQAFVDTKYITDSQPSYKY